MNVLEEEISSNLLKLNIKLNEEFYVLPLWMLYLQVFSKVDYTQKHEYVGIINFINLCLDKSGERDGFISKIYGYFNTSHSKEFQTYCKLLGTFLLVKYYPWSTNQQINESECNIMRASIAKVVESMSPNDLLYISYQYTTQFIGEEITIENTFLNTFSRNLGELVYPKVRCFPKI
jgi:hypothetical protein